MKRMYGNIKSCTSVQGQRFTFLTSHVGVRQGENLSPLLLSLYVNDMERFLIQKGNKFLDFNMDICEQYLKSLVRMYVDDIQSFSLTLLRTYKKPFFIN